MRSALLIALLTLLPLAARAHDAREQVRRGVAFAIGFGLASEREANGVPCALSPVCGDPEELRVPLPDGRAPWRAAYPHPVRSEPAACLPPRIDGPR